MITDEPYLEQRRLFGEAISRDPLELAVQYAAIRPLSLGNEVTKGIIGCDTLFGTDEEIEARFQLREGIKETYLFFECVLESDLSSEEQHLAARHPRTFRRLVELAMHSDHDAVVATGDHGYADNNYILSEDRKYITVARLPLTRPEDGCPFAGNNRTGAMDPLFKRFTTWTTRLVFAHHDASRGQIPQANRGDSRT